MWRTRSQQEQAIAPQFSAFLIPFARSPYATRGHTERIFPLPGTAPDRFDMQLQENASAKGVVQYIMHTTILRNPSLRRLRSYGDSAVPGVRRRSTTPGDGPPFSLCLVLAVSAWQTLEHWKADAQHWCSENS
uniref:Uncharacterized protein n=1 Tax=Anopheles merus TaxID=30066 RepID=A0A182VLL7_ANOME